MQVFDLIKILKIIKDRSLNVPFIVIIDFVKEDADVKILLEGVYDYITKGDIKRLVPIIKRALKEAELVSQNTLKEMALRNGFKK